MVESAAEPNRPSLKKKIEINIAKTTEVSLSADTNAMGETVMAHRTMAYPAKEMAEPNAIKKAFDLEKSNS